MMNEIVNSERACAGGVCGGTYESARRNKNMIVKTYVVSSFLLTQTVLFHRWHYAPDITPSTLSRLIAAKAAGVARNCGSDTHETSLSSCQTQEVSNR